MSKIPKMTSKKELRAWVRKVGRENVTKVDMKRAIKALKKNKKTNE